MLQADMEQVLENLDRRLSRVEQILPTLATKEDLKVFATKEDLDTVKRHGQVLYESLHDDIRIIAEGLVSVTERLVAVDRRVETLTDRLERKGVI